MAHMRGFHGSAMQVAGRCGLGVRRLCAAPSVSLLARSSQASAFGSSPSSWPLLRSPIKHQVAAAPQWLARVRCFCAAVKKEGTVKMWNEERGFGFLTPAGGGEDVFVHRSALNEGVTLAVGNAVTFEAIWDERKRKDRAGNVGIAPGGSDGGGSAAPSSGGGGGSMTPSSRSSPSQPMVKPTSHNMVGSFADWAVAKQPMTESDPAADGPKLVRHRLTVRDKAPKGSGNDIKKEEFQIVGDGNWDKRLFPAGGVKEEVVLLRPGEKGSLGEYGGVAKKGHGRNWAVEGRAGTAFDILLDPESLMVSCELAFSEK